MSDTVGTMTLQKAYNLRDKYAKELEAENDRLRKALAEIREIYAGSEGIPVAETAAEAYVVRLLEQMYTAAATALDY